MRSGDLEALGTLWVVYAREFLISPARAGPSQNPAQIYKGGTAMKTVWVWVLGIVVALMVIGLLFFGGADRRAYRRAKGVVEQRVGVQQDRIDTAVAMALKGVDLALVRAGDLPSQQAAADLVKQDITEIGERLKDSAELRGDAAVA